MAEASGRVIEIEAETPREPQPIEADIVWKLLIETIVRLVQNAFFKAILPGFDAELRRTRR